MEEHDISTAHPLPTQDESKENKIIVKFSWRDTRNAFYAKRKIRGCRQESLKSGFPWKQQPKQGMYSE